VVTPGQYYCEACWELFWTSQEEEEKEEGGENKGEGTGETLTTPGTEQVEAGGNPQETGGSGGAQEENKAPVREAQEEERAVALRVAEIMAPVERLFARDLVGNPKLINDSHVYSLIFTGQLYYWAWKHALVPSQEPSTGIAAASASGGGCLPLTRPLIAGLATAYCELLVYAATEVLPADSGWDTEKAKHMLAEVTKG
jgi:hypothetical protein